jgi:hypothetical protein
MWESRKAALGATPIMFVVGVELDGATQMGPAIRVG